MFQPHSIDQPAPLACPNCALPLVIAVVNRAYEGDVVHLRRRADCRSCSWHGFDWKTVPRSADHG